MSRILDFPLGDSSRIALILVLAALFAPGLSPAPVDRVATAQEAAPLPTELQFVPEDAAVFVHADFAKLWSGAIGKELRGADPKTSDDLTAKAKQLFGATPDSVQSVAAFWPKLKGPEDPASFGVAIAFKAAFNKDQLKRGIEQISPEGFKVAVHAPTDRVALILVGLDEQYAKPRPASKTGPLAAAIRDAGSGKHVVVVGSTLANLPDEVRGDDLPADFRAFQPLFRAETITGIIDLDKELAFEVRVKAASPPRAAEAEKGLGVLVALAHDGLGAGLKEVGDDKNPALKTVLAVMQAVQTGLKGAKFATEGEVARASVKIPTDLPFGAALLAAKTKVRDSAARAQSSNNLKQILIAMHNYHDTHGALPPAAVCDKTGKPMLSWRVLILPYIEQDKLYKEFKLDEPWDSEHNKKLIAKMPKTYASAASSTAKADETHYRAFVGNGAAFDYLKGSKLQEFADGTSNTLLVVTAKDAVPWTKPDELAFDPDKDMTKLLGFFPGDTCCVGMADGSARTLSKKISKETLHGAITKSGGEVLGDDF